MSLATSYPGIYIQELPSSTHTITAAATSITVFVGYTHPLLTSPTTFNKPIELFSFTDYKTWFGGFFKSNLFDAEASLFGDVAQAVNQFFLNGGAQAYVVGLLAAPFAQASADLATFQAAAKAQMKALAAGQAPTPLATTYPEARVSGPLTFFPLQPTDPNPNPEQVLSITIGNTAATFSGPSFSVPPPSTTVPYSAAPEFSQWLDDTADITITYGPPSTSPLAGYGTMAETYRQVSMKPTMANGKPNPNFVLTRLGGSSLVLVALNLPLTATNAYFQPTGGPVQFPATASPPAGSPPGATVTPWAGATSPAPAVFNANDFVKVLQQDSPLDKLSIFNLLVIPGVTNNLFGSVLSSATHFCEQKRAFLIMDPPRDNSADGTIPTFPILIEDTIAGNTPNETIPFSQNSALYFPYLTTNDPITGLTVNPVTNTPYEMPPSGTVAGIFANTDVTRGVWKAPAGLATTLTGVTGVTARGQMSDPRQGVLNLLGINCIRDFPGSGPVVWGCRTSVSSNPVFQQWEYVPVRRFALFLEQSLYNSLGWVVFEPNSPPLWTAIVQSIEAFLLGLYRQGAFQGTTPSQAFQVKCDSSTTTPADIANGIVNILVAFAPVSPAEFVVIQIAQLAGQAQS